MEKRTAPTEYDALKQKYDRLLEDYEQLEQNYNLLRKSVFGQKSEKKSKEAEFNLSIEDIRDFFQTGDKYKQNRDLIKKTIKPALAELNSSDYCLILDEAEIHLHTKGSPIQGIKFRAIVCDDKNDKAARLKAERLRLALEDNKNE